MLWLILGGCLAAALTAVIVVVMVLPRGPTSTPGSTSTSNASAPGAPTIDPASSNPVPPPDAATTLRLIDQQDNPAVSAVVDVWVPQLSAKKPGLEVDGQIFDDNRILEDHQQLRIRYPEARLLWSGDYSSFTSPDFWITIAAIPFSEPAQANAWCDARGLAPDQCFAKRVSTTTGPQASTQHR